MSLEVQARKFKADGNGNETEVPVHDWIDIGAFTKPASGRKYDDTLYRQRVHITQRNSEFTFTVARMPATAGIDPFALLIDRIPDDNLKDVTLDSGGRLCKHGSVVETSTAAQDWRFQDPESHQGQSGS